MRLIHTRITSSMNIGLTKISHNTKTGPIPVSTSSEKTCPDSCPFRNNGCYASGGPMKFHWMKITSGDRGNSYDYFCEQISNLPKNQLWRHNQAGDLAGKGDWINFDLLKQLVKANKGRKGFTYTHKPVLLKDIKTKMSLAEKRELIHNNREAIKFANDNGFTVNLSGNSVSHAQELQLLDIGPVVCIVPDDINESTKDFVVCPATQKEHVNCANCELCQKNHKKLIAFPAHGVSKKKVNSICQN